MRLSHIRLLVTNFDACFPFYRDVMGLEVTWGAEGEGYADFSVGDGTALALFQREVMSEALGTSNLPVSSESQDRTALIFQTDDLEGAVGELKQRGATFITEPRDRPDWGISTAHLRDPAGNLIELYSPLAHAEWTEDLKEEADKYAGTNDQP